MRPARRDGRPGPGGNPIAARLRRLALDLILDPTAHVLAALVAPVAPVALGLATTAGPEAEAETGPGPSPPAADSSPESSHS